MMQCKGEGSQAPREAKQTRPNSYSPKLKSASFIRFNFSTAILPQIKEPNEEVGSFPKRDAYTRLLKACLEECKLFQTRYLLDEMPQRKLQARKKCKILHGQSLKFGFGLKGNLGNAIVDLYAKCGDTHFAQMAFDRLDDRDVSSWNSILSLYSRCGLPEEVIRSFATMQNANEQPNQFTFALVLSACGRLGNIGLGRQVHCYVLKTRYESDSYCEGSLIDMYAKCDFVVGARQVFDGADNLDTVSWTSMIAGYFRVGSHEEAIEVFNDMKRVGGKPDQVAFVTVINACVGLGRLDDAVDLFSQMHAPNVVAWNVMISGHAQSGYSVESIAFYRSMRVYGIKPTRSTLGSVLSAIANLKAMDEGKRVHSEAIRLGLDSNVYVGSSLINMYAKCQIMESARNVFDELDEKNNVLWNAMLGGFAQNAHHAKVMEMFTDMRACGFQPDGFTYTSILSACACLENLDAGRQLHSFIIKSNLESNLYVGNAMVDMYAKSGDLKNARRLFELIQYPDSISWNAIIVGYVHEEDEDEALNMFRRMTYDKIVPDQVSLSSTLSACANIRALQLGKQVHCYSVKSGFDLNIYAGSSLIDMYAKCGVMETAHKVFTRMPEQSLVSRNALIAGYVQHNNSEKAMDLFQDMIREGMKPSKFTFASMVAACSGSVKTNMAKQVHCYTLKSGVLHDDEFLGVSLLGAYLSSDSKEDAKNLFMEFQNHRSRVLWTAIISGHAQNGHAEEALWLFKSMRMDDALPDQATFVSVLSACASLAALKEGRQIHSLVVMNAFNLDEYTCSALLDMYAKCGEVGNSVQVFNEIDCKKDVICWNSMIVGFAKNGYADDSLKIFDQMAHTCIKPDDITFLGVLSACSHAGMVSEGLGYYNDMINYHGIQPRSDHYACMIDLLGRGGRLKEAEQFINDLPTEPDAMVWASLLSACRLHGDDILGQRAAEKLIELEPQNSAPYILLSNIYAASKNWDGVNMVRKSMRERRVTKFPGCSWIVVGKKTDLFVAGDKLHPNAGEICALLNDMTPLMKDHGYIAPVDSILHDDD
ncbi:Pentatricopeptide repeat-containing protein [Thalictrum thalictroides]|uniref:Pentatricopeptide repeat-containing protein n=1 Tax=Thalictrum thalictroides TaxID=46969 RepID=A0A7J6VEZ4_THATH|nr:Pentatricopeptide repeat-containing protein [Thalictrum thalictroides]